MNNKKQQNTFISGMMLDSHPSTASDTMLTNCLNGTLITYGDNQYVLQNDLGNGKIYSDKDKQNPAKLPHELFFNKDSEDLTTATYSLCENLYRPVGMKEHNGILYIVSQNIKSRLYSEDETITLEVDSDSKYIITTKFTIESNSRDFDTLLPNYKVGFFNSTELTVSEFLQRIQQDIDKIDFQKFRHLDDENAIVYKGSEIGSFPSPQYGGLDGVFCDDDKVVGNEESKIIYQEQLYDSDGYKLDDSNLNFGDYFEIQFEDGGEIEYETTNNDGNKETVTVNAKAIDLSPYRGNNGYLNQNNLFQISFYLDYNNQSINLNNKGKIQYFYYKPLLNPSDTPRFIDTTLMASYKLKMEEYGKLIIHCNKSSLGSFIPSVFISDSIEDPKNVYLTGNVLLTYNCPDGIHDTPAITNNGLNLISYRTNLLSKIDLVVNNEHTVEITNYLEEYSKKTIWNQQIQRKIVFDNLKIPKDWIGDSQYVDLDLNFIGKHVINPEADSAAWKWEEDRVLMPVNTYNFKLDTKASINDGISLTGFTYTIEKDNTTGQDKYVSISATFAFKTKPLKGKHIKITATGYSLDWTRGQQISDPPVGITMYDGSQTEYEHTETIQIITANKTYPISNMKEGFLVFTAEIWDTTTHKVVIIDTQYILHYNNFIVSNGDSSTTNILNYSLFRQDINNTERETGRIIPYSVEIDDKNHAISDSIEIELTDITNKGTSIFYNPFIFENIPEKLTFIGTCDSRSVLGSGNLIYNDNLNLNFTDLYSTSNLQLNSDSIDVFRNIKEEYDVKINTNEVVEINRYAIQTEIPISHKKVNYYNSESLYIPFNINNFDLIDIVVTGNIGTNNYSVYINNTSISNFDTSTEGNYTRLKIKSDTIKDKIESLWGNKKFKLIHITLLDNSSTYVLVRKTEDGWNYLDFKNSNKTQIQKEYYNKAYIVRDNPITNNQEVDCYYYDQEKTIKAIEYNLKPVETTNILKYHTTEFDYNMPNFITDFTNQLKTQLWESYEDAELSDNVNWESVADNFYKTQYKQQDVYLTDTITTKLPVICDFTNNEINDIYKCSIGSVDFNCCYVKEAVDTSVDDYITYLANKQDSYVVYFISVRDDFIGQDTKQCLYSIYNLSNQKTITSFKTYKEKEEENELYAKLNEFDPLEEGSNIQLSYTNESQGHTVTLQLERPTNDTFYRIKDKNKWEHYETLKPIEHPEYYFPVILP